MPPGPLLRSADARSPPECALVSAGRILEVRLPTGTPVLPVNVPACLRVIPVPLRSFWVVGHTPHTERHGEIDLRHIVVVELRPFIARPVIVRENVAHAERSGRDAGVRKSGVVAAPKERVAV